MVKVAANGARQMTQWVVSRVFIRALDSLPDDRLVRWMIAGLLAVATFAAAAAAQARTAPQSFADLAERLLPSVVNIATTQTLRSSHPGIEIPQFPPGSPFEDFFKHFFDRQGGPHPERRATSLGSGFIIQDSYVVTNNHVIEEAEEITVILHDDTRLEAELVGRDPKTDVAVLKIKNGRELSAPPLVLGQSDSVRVGDWVLAIGNPFGLGGTVTAGIVSARGRDINAGPYDDFIQTDASINKGNSGGPMFNTRGQVIGINTAIYSPSGGSVGIGFALAMDVAEPVIRQLIKYGRTKRGWLGVSIQNVTQEVAESLGLDAPKGVLVAAVSRNGPADEAGIEAGDVILAFDGREVPEMRDLSRMVAEAEVDRKVSVTVWREGRKRIVEVSVGEREEAEPSADWTHDGGAELSSRIRIPALGLWLTPPTEAVRERFGLGDGEIKGIVVSRVDSDGPAAEKGIQPGDIIVEVNQREVATAADVEARIKEARDLERRSVLLFIERDGDLRIVGVRLLDGG